MRKVVGGRHHLDKVLEDARAVAQDGRRAVERVDAVRVVQPKRERVDGVGDVVRVRVEGLELVHELARRRLEGFAGRHVEVARHLVDLEEAKEVAALFDGDQTRRIEEHSLVLADGVLLPVHRLHVSVCARQRHLVL